MKAIAYFREKPIYRILSPSELKEEYWQDVSGSQGQYIVSSMGRVKNKSGHILRPCKNKMDGYWYLVLKGRSEKLHRIVATEFAPNPENKKYVDHKHGDKDDNRASELRWVTFQENIDNAWETGAYNFKGSNSTSSILTDNQVMKIKKMISDGITCKNIQKEFGTTIWAIYDIKQGRTWGHLQL
jgi:hypothetical protein